MKFNYISRGFVGLMAAGIVLSATESQWFYQLNKRPYSSKQKVTEEKNPATKNEVLEEELIKIEVLCPEHQWINHYQPISKDPRIIYFWNREIKTNKVERSGVSRKDVRRVV